MTISGNLCNGVKTFLVNLFKIIIDIPFYIYLFLRSLLISLITLCTRRRRKNLDEETILVTGAATGLGQLVVLKLAKISQKANFILWDINEPGLAETVEKCRQLGATNVHGYVVDLSNYQDVVRTAGLVRTQVGTVTTLFNNAGFSPYKLFQDLDPETEERVLRVNLLSQMWTIREFLPDMITKGSGHLVSTCSGLAFHRFPCLSTYVASKHGLRGFIDVLKLEMAMHPEKPHISFTVIYPGWVKTEMTNGVTWDARYDIDVLTKLEPEYVAEKMVQGILKEEEEVFIPSSVKYSALLFGCLPASFKCRLETHLFRNIRATTTNTTDTFVV